VDWHVRERSVGVRSGLAGKARSVQDCIGKVSLGVEWQDRNVVFRSGAARNGRKGWVRSGRSRTVQECSGMAGMDGRGIIWRGTLWKGMAGEVSRG